MKRISPNSLFLIFLILLTGCKSYNRPDHNDSLKIKNSISQTVKNSATKETEDSMKLTDLVRRLYKWHVKDTMRADGFKPQKRSPSDTLFTSIDLDENKKAVEELKETGFFFEDFLDDYRKIAVRMDKELRNGKSLWPDGELPTFNDDVDEWCNCQDYPDDYWEKIVLTNIKFNKGEASFKWTWGDNFYYKAKAKKEGGVWKIS